MPDIHSGQRTEQVDSARDAGVDFSLIRVIHGRDNESFGVHATPFEHYLSGGIDRDDLLVMLGFRAGGCSITRDRETHCMEVGPGFDLVTFVGAFARAFTALHDAEQRLERCGFFLGTRQFPARSWINTQGDGHSGAKVSTFAEEASEDTDFRFAFTWVGRSEGDGGWTTHIRAKEQPLSPEIRAAFRYLGLADSAECIEFDFESCTWRNVRREGAGRSVFDGNNDTAFKWFRALKVDFSPALQLLLDAERELNSIGMHILPQPAVPHVRVSPSTPDLRTAVALAAGAAADDEFDVAISYAGPDREHAEELATLLRDQGVKVFYDRFYRSSLWGKDLAAYFDRIFRQRARYCVMFISPAYRDRVWTIAERRSALARMIDERGKEYVLPVVVEQVDLDGLPPTIGHLSLSEHTIADIAESLIEKLSA
jgi:hypothetical protein